MNVAVLYVMGRSHYRSMPGVEAWGEREDATLYRGPHPVVAHPPCESWSAFWGWTARQDRRHLGPLAVDQVRKWGGVLEHPAYSGLWDDQGLPAAFQGLQVPLFLDPYGGLSIEVSQCWWGHPSPKRTWLYLVGVPFDRIELPAVFKSPHYDTTQATFRIDKRTGRTSRRSASDMLSAESRRRTRPAFAEWLVNLARHAQPSRQEIDHG